MTLRLSAASVLVMLLGTLPGFAEDHTSRRVLFLGNSVFYYQGGVYPAFEGFFREAGLEVKFFDRREFGPCCADWL